MALSLHGIARTVEGEVHVAGVDLTLAPGTMNVLLGHTGAGKTSLLRIIAGLDRPTQGTVRHGTVDITRRPARMRSVALVYQQFINYPSLTVRDNIASPLRLRRARDTDARVRELARLLRIEDLLDRLPGALSGGQQQRVAIARALAKGAEIVLLDEPLVNLDYKLREDLRDELRALFGRRGPRVRRPPWSTRPRIRRRRSRSAARPSWSTRAGCCSTRRARRLSPAGVGHGRAGVQRSADEPDRRRRDGRCAGAA